MPSFSLLNISYIMSWTVILHRIAHLLPKDDDLRASHKLLNSERML